MLIVCIYARLNSGDFSLSTGDYAAQRQPAQHGGGPRKICYRGQVAAKNFRRIRNSWC